MTKPSGGSAYENVIRTSEPRKIGKQCVTPDPVPRDRAAFHR